MNGIGLSMASLALIGAWKDFEPEVSSPRHRSVGERIAASEFAPTVMKTRDPAVPPLLEKHARDLTPEEIVALPLILSAYKAELAENSTQHGENEQRIEQAHLALKAALAEELRLTDHPKLDVLWSLANEVSYNPQGYASRVRLQQAVATNFSKMAILLID